MTSRHWVPLRHNGEKPSLGLRGASQALIEALSLGIDSTINSKNLWSIRNHRFATDIDFFGRDRRDKRASLYWRWFSRHV